MRLKHHSKAQTLLSFADFQICPVYISAEMNTEYWKWSLKFLWWWARLQRHGIMWVDR